MIRIVGTTLLILALTTCVLSLPVLNPAPVIPGITLIGKGVVSGSALDKSGLTGNNNPSSDPNAELLGNTAGRQANRGMEGLAISPDGTTLFGIMQNA